MKFTYALILLFAASISYSQNQPVSMQYEPDSNYPFGRLNPEALPQTGDFSQIIGICDCKSVSRNPDGTWQDELDMVWKFKYIMNGMAVQDEVWRENNLYAGSIRQYHPDSSQWVVTYFSAPAVPYKPGVWHGSKIEDEIVLTQPQKSPNGMDGFSKLKFYDISEEGFKWLGEWIDTKETITYPFWRIECKKRE